MTERYMIGRHELHGESSGQISKHFSETGKQIITTGYSRSRICVCYPRVGCTRKLFNDGSHV